jgi:transposase InsO family protein
VSDNGPAYKADAFTRFVEARPWLAHVRTRYRSPQSNGVIERFYETVKYEHLYRQDIANGIVLNDELAKFRHVYNELRPHEHLGILTPGEAYRADPSLTLAAVEAMLYP